MLDHVERWIAIGAAGVALAAVIGAVIAAIVAARSAALSRRAFELAHRYADAADTERRRRPRLYLLVDGCANEASVALGYADEGYEPRFSARLAVANDGDRVARNAVLDLRIPHDFTDQSVSAGSLVAGRERVALLPFGSSYLDDMQRLVHAVPDRAIRPNDVPVPVGTIRGSIAKATEHGLPRTFRLPWYISSEEGAWNGVLQLTLQPYVEMAAPHDQRVLPRNAGMP